MSKHVSMSLAEWDEREDGGGSNFLRRPLTASQKWSASYESINSMASHTSRGSSYYEPLGTHRTLDQDNEEVVIIETSSFKTSILNLVNNIVGAGVLLLPFALKKASFGTGIILLLIVWAISTESMNQLVRCSHLVAQFSYQQLGVMAFGESMGTIVEACIMFFTFGTCNAYIVLIADFFLPVMKSWAPDTILTERHFIIPIIVGCCLLPLCFIRSLNKLRFTSALAIGCVVYTALYEIVKLFKEPYVGGVRGAEGARTEVVDPTVDWWELDTALFSSIALMSVSFTAHYNVLAFYEQLRRRSTRRMRYVTWMSTTMCLILYIVMGLAGYFTFGKYVESDVLNNYDSHDTFATIGRLGLVIVIIFSFPLAFYAFRGATERVILRGRWSDRDESPYASHIVTTVLVVVTAIMPMIVEKVEVIFGLKSALFGSFIVFIFPGMVFLKLRKKHNVIKMKDYARAGASITFGLIMCVCGTMNWISDRINE